MNREGKFIGPLMWALIPKMKHTRHASIERAILRPDALLLDFTEGGTRYDVELRKTADIFAGRWRTPGTQNGYVGCRLITEGDGLSLDGDVLLRGVWREKGQDWKWAGVLVRVEQFDMAESDE